MSTATRNFAAAVLTAFLALLAVSYVPSSAIAQTSYRSAPPSQLTTGRNIQVKMLMPSSLTAIATKTVHVRSILVSNPTSSAATFTLQDGDGSAYALATSVSISANGFYNVAVGPDGVEFKDGIYISSSSGSLVLRLKGWSDEL